MSRISRHEFGRRQFLIASSTCALATAVVGPKLFAGAVTPPKRLAVGFASVDENAAFHAASSVPAGDGGFISRGARITVSGASGASLDPRQRRGVELLTHYSYLDGVERREAPFTAWAGSRNTGCQGNSVGFNVPVDEQQSLRFSVVVESGAALPVSKTSRRRAIGGKPIQSQAMPVTLALRNEPGSLNLVRGFYVIVPMFENDSEPRWYNWQVRRVDGRMALVDGGGNTAPFEHFVLRIDYATL